jgi:methionyl-tRNA formyltransferase
MGPIRVYVAGAWDSMLTSGVLAGLVGVEGIDLVGLDLDRLDPVRLRAAAPDLLISAGHQYLIAPSEIAVARLGTVGLHPALLPRYRGSHPLWWAIHNHETKAGITLYRLDAGIDTGPIIAQRTVPILPGDTFRTLYRRTVKEIPSILAELRVAIDRAGELPAGTVQDEAQASYFGPPTERQLRGSLFGRIGRRAGRFARSVGSAVRGAPVRR